MIERIWSVTLTVTDLKRAIGFYKGVLGLTKKYEFKDYAGFDCGGVEIGVKTWGERSTPRAGEPCLDLLVNDVDATYRELASNGVRFTEGPHDALWGARIAGFADPDGNSLQLTEIRWPKYLATIPPQSQAWPEDIRPPSRDHT
jgi:catechol 2,3-dioxygenase-like lactoylglutathione lyase family enzyme